MWPTWTVRWIQCHNNGGKKQKDSKQQESSSFPHPCSHGLWLPMKAATSVKHKSGKFTQHKHHSLRKLWAPCWINPLRLKPHINLQVSRNNPVPGYGAVPAVSSPKHTTQRSALLFLQTSLVIPKMVLSKNTAHLIFYLLGQIFPCRRHNGYVCVLFWRKQRYRQTTSSSIITFLLFCLQAHRFSARLPQHPCAAGETYDEN